MKKPARPPSPAVRKPPLRHRLHRTTGIATGLVLLYLIATGLPLQFTHPLDLGNRYVTSPLVLDWYGIGAPQSGWQSGSASYVGGLVFLDDRPVAEAEDFLGAASANGVLAVATGPALLLMAATQPGVVETVHLPTTAVRIGSTADRVVVELSDSLRSLEPETLILEETDADPDDVQWAHLTTLTGTALEPYRDAARSRILPLERLLQDLHSGRAFGPAGEWFVAAATVALALLAVSGFWIWWRSR